MGRRSIWEKFARTPDPLSPRKKSICRGLRETRRSLVVRGARRLCLLFGKIAAPTGVSLSTKKISICLAKGEYGARPPVAARQNREAPRAIKVWGWFEWLKSS